MSPEFRAVAKIFVKLVVNVPLGKTSIQQNRAHPRVALEILSRPAGKKNGMCMEKFPVKPNPS